MTQRAIEGWLKRDPRKPRPKLGRKGHAKAKKLEALKAVRAEHQKPNTKKSYRRIYAALAGRYPMRLVERYSCALRRAKRKVRAQWRKAIRKSMRICMGNAVWSIDATHLDRKTSGEETKALSLHDDGSDEFVGIHAGPPPSSKDTAQLLIEAFEKRGAPLVVFSDNGAENIGDEVKAVLDQYRVVHLRSLPRTPTHNGRCERSHRDLKDVLGLEKGCEPARLGHQEWNARLSLAKEYLNKELRRPTRGNLSASAFQATLPPWYASIQREEFYGKVGAAVANAVRNAAGPRARRIAEREAILQVMETFGLIRRWTGAANPPHPKCENIS